MSNAWNQTRQMKRLDMGPMTIPEYNDWRVRRINDNIPEPSHETVSRWRNIYESSLLN
ncbi:hypothetical protein Godav_028966 [Gossypium davidsonii]|uniref:Uncharacterized protein n=2 Tax=Gossypium TaxID=3633 RepID=A0A7J8TJ01_GOSDV|nr:hypothetical protein [Gossypium davidsonii]MBA0641737.1 hypothetical protein [Gossypium klotzschianum]